VKRITDEDRAISYLAAADLPTLQGVRRLIDVLILKMEGPKPKTPRTAKKKDKANAAQTSLPGVKTDAL